MVNIGRINKCLFQLNQQILKREKCFKVHGKYQILEQYPPKIQHKVSPRFIQLNNLQNKCNINSVYHTAFNMATKEHQSVCNKTHMHRNAMISLALAQIQLQLQTCNMTCMGTFAGQPPRQTYVHQLLQGMQIFFESQVCTHVRCGCDC